MATTTLTSKGQITLPKAVRERLSLREGDRLRVSVGRGGRMTLERESRPPLEAVCGLLGALAAARPVSVAKMREAVRRRARHKHSRAGR
jgi:AbrB family looped-hinge helix DNA binding protein